MIPIQNIFTGQGVGTVYTDTSRTDRAVENFYRQQYEMNKNMLLDAQARQKQFLDYTSIEPIQAISKKHQADQVLAIEKFQKDAQSVYNKRGGRLNTADYMELQNMKNDLTSWQQNLKANQALYMQDQAIKAHDPLKYDDNAFQKAEQDFFMTGIWNREKAFVPSGNDLNSMFVDLLRQATPTEYKNLSYDEAGNVKSGTIVSKYDNMRDQLRGLALQNPELITKLQIKFNSLATSKNESEQAIVQGYLDKYDANDNNIAEPSEKRNAVMEFGLDYYAPKQDIVKKQIISDEARPRQGDGVINIGIGVGGGKHKNFMNKGNTAGVFNSGVPGLNFVPDNMSPFNVGSDGLTTLSGVELPSSVVVVPINAANGTIEFVASGQGIKKYEMDKTTNQKKKFTEDEVEALKVSDSSIKTEPAGTVPSKWGTDTLFYVYTTPSNVPAKGNLNTYLDVVSKNATKEGILDRNEILKYGGFTTQEQAVAKPLTNKYKRK